MLTPAKKDKAIAIVEVIGELAREAGVNVFCIDKALSRTAGATRPLPQQA